MGKENAQVTIMTMNLRFGLARDNENGWQYLLHEIIFEADTRVGKYFDFFLIPK